MASELNRDELAARVLVAMLTRENLTSWSTAAGDAVEYADALLARLASRPSSTGSADGDARDHHGGGSLDKPYVPKVGDVVGIDGGNEYGETRVVTGVDCGDVAYLRLRTSGEAICRHKMPASDVTYLRPATPAERIAAGLDQPAPVAPAIDREGAAMARSDAHTEWLNASDGEPFAFNAGWDAAIAYMRGAR